MKPSTTVRLLVRGKYFTVLRQQMHNRYYKINITISIAPKCFDVINTIHRELSVCVS